MKLTYSGPDVGVIHLSDIGDFNTKNVDGQNTSVKQGAILTLRDSDLVMKSYLRGAIKKFVTTGNLVVTIPPLNAIQTVQEIVAGIAPGPLTTTWPVNVVTSMLAFITGAGTPAPKTLLALGVDYTIVNKIINLVTPQVGNSLVISYQTDLA